MEIKVNKNTSGKTVLIKKKLSPTYAGLSHRNEFSSHSNIFYCLSTNNMYKQWGWATSPHNISYSPFPSCRSKLLAHILETLNYPGKQTESKTKGVSLCKIL